ncbi:MAG: glycosyltransferase [Oscillochloris sp.]|nr:glycosyltransferase [Oscillochloris sp.]
MTTTVSRKTALALLPVGLEISVVVPTCGRPELLIRCLDALVEQVLDATLFELIVVDDGCCDATRSLVAAYADRGGPQVRYLRTTGRRGPAVARNLGWQQARSPCIAFTDDDCIPAPHWLAAGLEALNTGADGVAGRVHVPVPECPTDYERNCGGLNDSRFVTASCFYRRAALAAVGGFDERFAMAWREDSDLFFNLLVNGHSLIDAPEALVLHPIRAAPWGVSLQQQRKNLFNALLYKKHPALYRRHLAPVTPWHYYSILVALLAAIGGAIARNRPLAGIGWLFWALLSGRFCARRLHGTSRRPGHMLEMLLTSVLIPPLAIFWRIAGAIRFRVPFV